MNRNAMYGLVHKGIKALLTARMGFFDDDEYRNHLSLRTGGKTSCKAMSDGELRQLVDALKSEGFLDAPCSESLKVSHCVRLLFFMNY